MRQRPRWTAAAGPATGQLLAAALAVLLPFPSVAATYVVKPDGTGDFPTIQDAVDGVSDGDEILLANGIYFGPGNRDVDYSGKAITIRSQGGDPALCTIDVSFLYGYRGNAFIFQSGEGPSSVLEGVRVANLTDPPEDLPTGGGPIPIRGGSAPVLRNLLIENNWLGDGAVDVNGGSVVMQGCTIRNNRASGVVVRFGTATLTGCTIEANTTYGSAGGGILSWMSQVTLESCRINRNASSGPDFREGGGGISFGGGSLTATDCQILENTSPDRAGGLFLGYGATVSLTRVTIAGNRAVIGGGIYGTSFSGTLDNSILWGNCATSSGPDAELETGSMLTAMCSDVDPAQVTGGGTLILGSGSVTVDPLFCQPRLCGDALSVRGIYDLQDASPLIGLAGCGTPGFPTGSCAVSIAPTSWGKIKAGYR